jgi:hypothetical protein
LIQHHPKPVLGAAVTFLRHLAVKARSLSLVTGNATPLGKQLCLLVPGIRRIE